MRLFYDTIDTLLVQPPLTIIDTHMNTGCMLFGSTSVLLGLTTVLFSLTTGLLLRFPLVLLAPFSKLPSSKFPFEFFAYLAHFASEFFAYLAELDSEVGPPAAKIIPLPTP